MCNTKKQKQIKGFYATFKNFKINKVQSKLIKSINFHFKSNWLFKLNVVKMNPCIVCRKYRLQSAKSILYSKYPSLVCSLSRTYSHSIYRCYYWYRLFNSKLVQYNTSYYKVTKVKTKSITVQGRLIHTKFNTNKYSEKKTVNNHNLC